MFYESCFVLLFGLYLNMLFLSGIRLLKRMFFIRKGSKKFTRLPLKNKKLGSTRRLEILHLLTL